MKSLFVRSSLIAAVVVGLSAFPAGATRITLLHVNDTHAHVFPWGPKDFHLEGTRGGLARAATIIQREQSRDPSALFVHGGDFLHGDFSFNLTYGVPELLSLQKLGLDVLAIGNHEFEFGPEFLTAVLAGAWPGGGGVAVVGTNLDLTGFPVLANWIAPTYLKDVSGVKVGFFGLTLPDDPLNMPDPVHIGTDLAGISSDAVASLKAQGAQVIVCLAHLDRSTDEQIASTVPGIDVIVGAHNHITLSQPEVIDRPGGGQTYLVFAGSFYGWVGRLRLQVDGTQVGLEDYRLFEVNASVPSEPQTKAALAPLKEAIVTQFGEVYRRPLAWALLPITNEIDPRTNKRDTAIGDLITDAYREAGHAEIAVEAGGFIDEGLPWGVVVGNDVFHTMPYGFPDATTGLGFHVATFTLSGAELLGALEYTLAAQGDFTPQVSGMTFRYDSRQPPFGQVLVETLRIRGQPFDPERRYRIAANEAVALRFLPALGAQPQDVFIGGFAYDAIRDLVERRGLLFPVVGRIVDVGAVSQP